MALRAERSLKKLNVLRPRQRDQHAHSGGGAAIEKPARRRVINAHEVDPDLAHQRKIDIYLFGAPEIISLRVRLERTVGDALDKKLPVAFEKEFRDGANARFCGHRFDRASRITLPVRSISSGVCAVEINPVSNCDGAK